MKELALGGYKLTVNHIKALCKTFESDPGYLNKFIFFNCGLGDKELALLFSAMPKLNYVTAISLRFC